MLMSYEEFLNEVVKELTAAGYRVELKEHMKCNITRLCFNVKVDDELSMMIPAYDYWEAYADDEIEFDDIIRSLLVAIKASIANAPDVSNMFTGLKDYEAVREKLYIRVVNTERNEEWLKGIPHKDVYDLSITYAMQVGECETIAVSDDLLKKWNITLDQLIADATENAAKTKPVISQSMFDVMTSEPAMPGLTALVPEDGDPYIITCEDKCFGAAVLFYPNMLQDIAAKLEDNYYILPSSIHEVIVIPAKAVDDVEALKRMVREVNESGTVEEDDLLSYSVYFYNGTELTIA